VGLVPQTERANLSASFRFSSTRTMNCSWKASTRSRRPTTTRSFALQQFLPVDRQRFRCRQCVPVDHRSAEQPSVLPIRLAGSQRACQVGKPISVSYRAFDAGNRSTEDMAKLSHLVIGMRGVVKVSTTM
jgi:iron complex outermembrane receptor protein